tara:strand:+ start:455 stop:688 length:234 start_codon:yes stop_codon:yes gene_type:complete
MTKKKVDQVSIDAIELFSRKFSLLTELLKQKARNGNLDLKGCQIFRNAVNNYIDEMSAACLNKEAVTKKIEDYPSVW